MFAEKERQNLTSKKARDNQSPHSITTNFDKVLQKSLKQKLFDQTTKNDLMQEALTQQKETFKNILEDLKHQHEARIFEMENTLTLTQQLVRQQASKLKDQVEKLVLSDNVIEQLIAENENLTFKLSLTKIRD